jgi:RNA-directed DNA polymerase
MSSYKKTELIQIQPPLALIDHAPFIFDDFSLALRLGVRCRTLWYCIQNKRRRYKIFTIPKSNGKKRVIHNPDRVLKFIQRRIAQSIILPQPIGEQVGAYVQGKSCKDAAERHVGHAIRIGMDLKDFFPTHSRGKVRWFMHEHFGYSQFVSGLIADLLTAPFGHKHKVPQGSPASPALCNLMAQETLDKAILERLSGTQWVYTRYSDDLTFSHPEDVPRTEVNRLLRDVRKLITKSGYKTNLRKTKIQRRWRRQKMLGMVINEKTSIPRDTYRKYRAILHNCMQHGFEPNEARYSWDGLGSFKEHLRGKISYFKSIDPEKGAKLEEAFNAAVAKWTAPKEDANPYTDYSDVPF